MTTDGLLGLLLGTTPAIGIAVGKTYLKWASTAQVPGSPWYSVFSRQDFCWWMDWVVSAAFAMALFVYRAAKELDAKQQSVTVDAIGSSFTTSIIILIIILAGGVSFVPVLTNKIGFNPPETNEDDPDQVAEPTLRIGRGIVVPNLLAFLILVAVVSAGVGGAA